MNKKFVFLFSIVLTSCIKLSPITDVSGHKTHPPVPVEQVQGFPLCITPQTRAWDFSAKFLSISAKKTFSIVGKDKATNWREVRLNQESNPGAKMALGAPSSYDVIIKSIKPSGNLACKKTGELYLTPKPNKETVWNAVAHPSTGYPTTYTSQAYGFQLDAAKMITKKKKVGNKKVSILVLKK